MSEAAWKAELGFVDSIWPKIKEAIDGSIFALDTSSPGVEGALKVAADIALTNWREGQAVSLPDRETLVNAADAALEVATVRLDDTGEGFTPAEIAVDAVLAALSTQPAAGEVEYRRVMPDGRPRLDATFETMPELDEGWTAQQRTVGPWIEVQPAAQPTELAELFPGTLAALDNLSIRPEVQS